MRSVHLAVTAVSGTLVAMFEFLGVCPCALDTNGIDDRAENSQYVPGHDDRADHTRQEQHDTGHATRVATSVAKMFEFLGVCPCTLCTNGIDDHPQTSHYDPGDQTQHEQHDTGHATSVDPDSTLWSLTWDIATEVVTSNLAGCFSGVKPFLTCVKNFNVNKPVIVTIPILILVLKPIVMVAWYPIKHHVPRVVRACAALVITSILAWNLVESSYDTFLIFRPVFGYCAFIQLMMRVNHDENTRVGWLCTHYLMEPRAQKVLMGGILLYFNGAVFELWKQGSDVARNHFYTGVSSMGMFLIVINEIKFWPRTGVAVRIGRPAPYVEEEVALWRLRGYFLVQAIACGVALRSALHKDVEVVNSWPKEWRVQYFAVTWVSQMLAHSTEADIERNMRHADAVANEFRERKLEMVVRKAMYKGTRVMGILFVLFLPWALVHEQPDQWLCTGSSQAWFLFLLEQVVV